MSDLENLYHAQEHTRHWRAECENASARLELAQWKERMAQLMSQYQPVASLELDRERLRLALEFVRHGDIRRLDRDFADLKEREAK